MMFAVDLLLSQPQTCAVAELSSESRAGARRLGGRIVVVDEVRGRPRSKEDEHEDREQHRHLDHRLAAPGVAKARAPVRGPTAHHCWGSSRKRFTVVLLNVVVPINSV